MRPRFRHRVSVQALLGAVLGFTPALFSAQTAGAAPVTFHRDIAPIIFKNCSVCHRPGQSAPFSLLNYADAHKHGKQIREVTEKRIMPPWLPEPGYGHFIGERILSEAEIRLLGEWVSGGMAEGDPADAPRPPEWPEGWTLGKPDLIVHLAQPYLLPADGRDVYRNFAIPIPTESARYVAAMEFHPGNKAVHHAFVRLDKTSESRRLDEMDPQPGFDGMDVPVTARTPDGQILSWQPGKTPRRVADGLAWTLSPGADLVLQLHLHPTGKVEPVQPEIGFYFTDKAPTNTPFKVSLISFAIDIPPGESRYKIKDSFRLPVDVELLSVLPHAHYLGEDLKGYAILPDGSRKWLLWIKSWDFNWQGDYQYAQPLSLPAGTILEMEFTYNNSTNNIRNPSNPPKRVKYGVQTTDEMAELWLQVLPRNRQDFDRIAAAYQPNAFRGTVDYNTYRLSLNPNDARAHTRLGEGLLGLKRREEAAGHLRRAIEIDPMLDEAHYFLALDYRLQNKPREAQAEFEAVLKANPNHAKAHGNLGLILMDRGDFPAAIEHFQAALRLNPEDEISHDSLGIIFARSGRFREAEAHLREAVRLAPRDEQARKHLENFLSELARQRKTPRP